MGLNIGARIKKLRTEKGLKQSDLAEKAKISRVAVGNYERNERQPTIDIASRIAAALGVSLDFLIYGYEIDEEYELICDTLENAGIIIEQAIEADKYYIAHAEDPEPPEEREEIDYGRLAEVVHKILIDAEANKAAYIKKRLEAELFWPKGGQHKP